VPRGVDGAWQAEAESNRAAPVWFMDADFGPDAGFFRVWTGVGAKAFEGHDYLGGGLLVGVEAGPETADGTSSGLSFTVACRDPATLRDHVLDATLARVGGDARLHLAWLADDGSLAGTPEPWWWGTVSKRPDVVEQPDGVVLVRVQAEEDLADLDRSARYRMTAASQVAIDAEDRGLEYRARLPHTKVLWAPRWYNRDPND
jgi:hypothetical protein